MTKSIFGLMMVMAVCGTAVFAQEAPSEKAPAPGLFSAGAGGYFTSDFGGGLEVSSSNVTMKTELPYFGGGGFVFLDATYAELSLGFFAGGGKIKSETNGKSGEDKSLSYTGLDIELLGKYPIAVSEKLSVFPLLGVKYRAMLSVKNEDGDVWENSDGDDISGDFSALWFKLGGGLDFSFTPKIYLRLDALYGIRLANKMENDQVDSYNDMAGLDAKALLGHGLEVKVGVGYRF
jgi:hypothetical protein